MNNRFFIKGFVMGTIFLFIGASFLPSIASDETSKPCAVVIQPQMIWKVDYDYTDEETGERIGDGNFTRIQDAINAASSGDSIFVYSGCYEENLVVNKSKLLIRGCLEELGYGYDTGMPIIDGKSLNDVIKIMEDEVSIINLVIRNSGYADAGILIGSFAYNVVTQTKISHCYIFDNHKGIQVEDEKSVHTLIENCSITNNKGPGIIVLDSKDLSIKNCIVSSNKFGIDIRNSFEEFEITDSHVTNNDGWGLALEGIMYRSIIKRNTSRGNSQTGIYFYGSFYGSNVLENDIYDNGGRQNVRCVGPTFFNTFKNNYWGKPYVGRYWFKIYPIPFIGDDFPIFWCSDRDPAGTAHNYPEPVIEP